MEPHLPLHGSQGSLQILICLDPSSGKGRQAKTCPDMSCRKFSLSKWSSWEGPSINYCALACKIIYWNFMSPFMGSLHISSYVLQLKRSMAAFLGNERLNFTKLQNCCFDYFVLINLNKHLNNCLKCFFSRTWEETILLSHLWLQTLGWENQTHHSLLLFKKKILNSSEGRVPHFAHQFFGRDL